MATLKCDMRVDCKEPVTHLDNKGYVYCTGHGEQRRSHDIPCRKLRSHEITKLTRGETIKKY